MGSQSLRAAIEDMKQDQAILWHLQGNHYPPLPASLLPVCKRVLKLYRQGKYDHNVRLPEGITCHGKKTAPVTECMKAWHLYDFVS